jgi:hypothetical protein
VIDRLPQLGTAGDYLKQLMQDKLVEHGETRGSIGGTYGRTGT